MADYNKVLPGLIQNHLEWERTAIEFKTLLSELTDSVRETTKILYAGALQSVFLDKAKRLCMVGDSISQEV